MAEQTKSTTTALREALPTDELNEEFHRLIQALVGRVLSTATHHVGGLTGKLENIGSSNGSDEDGSGQSGGMGSMLGKAGEALSEGKSPARAAVSAGAQGVKDKVKNLFKGGGGKGGGGKKLKVTNIVESIDVGAPIDVVYKQWTQFSDFASFMKKVENVDQEDETKTKWKAQVFWSHREWEATITDQVPQERIVWTSGGAKGHVDGAVTFHELGPNLTRVLVVLEYHPQGLFERTGNLWRAQGRRARLELKHFRRHVTTQAVLHPDELQGWLGEIHDGEVTKSDEDARAELESAEGDEDRDEDRDEHRDQEDQADGQDESSEYDEDGQDEEDAGARDEFDDDEDDLPEEDEQDDEPRDELDEDDEDDEEGYEDEEDDEGARAEYDEYDEEDEDSEDDEPQQEPSRRERRPAGAGRR